MAAGLPEVIYTSEENTYLHLPGVIVAESSAGETRYLLSDGLGSVRQALDENGALVAYNEFDPYGNPVQNNSEPYGFTGEWWEDEVGLLHLRARWYLPGTGTFVSRDAVESEPPYAYVRENPVNRLDPSGLQSAWPDCLPQLGSDNLTIPPGCVPPTPPPECLESPAPNDIRPVHCYDYPEYLLPSPQQRPVFHPFWQGVTGAVEVSEALYNSNLQFWSDGMIFGIAGSQSSIFSTDTMFSNVFSILTWDLAFNNVCLPDTGITGGYEIVFDFVHRERAIFSYKGDVLNIGTLLNSSITRYVGKTNGFINNPGVDAYGGYLTSGSLNAGVSTPWVETIGGGGSIIVAAPLDRNKNLSRNGVFATYYGVGAGISLGPSVPTPLGVGATANGEIAVTYYEMLDWSRTTYVPSAFRQYSGFKASAAMMMQQEMNLLAALDPIARTLMPKALIELWSFVYR